MKSLLDVPAPAKLNLFLHITGQRPDGYHLLQSVFMLIDWCDTLHFEKRPVGSISREDLTLQLPPEDLITRAAKLLQEQTGCPYGVHISVEKQIPAQAGMGGGSSDAATCLLALNQLWGLDLGLQTLEKLMCLFSCAAKMPGWRASVKKLARLNYPLRNFGSSNLPAGWKPLKFLNILS